MGGVLPIAWQADVMTVLVQPVFRSLINLDRHASNLFDRRFAG